MTNMITIEVNGKSMEAEQGELLLEVLRRNGIQIPTLCHMRDFIPTGTCRICVVELEGSQRLITACSFPVYDGMKVKTHSPRVLESRKTIVELLLSNHPDDCLYCARSMQCELQGLAREYQVNERRIRGAKSRHKIDHSGASIVRDPDKCILCGRCVRVCEEVMGVACIDFVNRGSKTIIGTTLQQGLNNSSCVNCGQCIMVCPTGALIEKDNLQQAVEVLLKKDKKLVVQYAPAISVSIAEAFGMPAGKDINGLLNAALRKMGFDRVFDTTFAADLTIMEEAAELIKRVSEGGKLPMFTSCCPAWIKYSEEFAPDFLENLSSCKSPQQMMGAVIKSWYAQAEGWKPADIISVSIMPCTAKKFESTRATMGRDGVSDVDLVLTTRELINLIKMYGIDLHKLEPEMTNSPLGTRTTAGKIFGASGGVMEAALRTAYKTLTGKEMIEFRVTPVRGLKGRKETQININGLNIGIAVVSGLANAGKLLEEIRNGRNDLHFIEIMACPGGCIAGGGQNFTTEKSVIEARMQSLYEIDERENIRVSHKNPEVCELYTRFLGEPLGHKSHELLHTEYQKRDVLI